MFSNLTSSKLTTVRYKDFNIWADCELKCELQIRNHVWSIQNEDFHNFLLWTWYTSKCFSCRSMIPTCWIDGKWMWMHRQLKFWHQRNSLSFNKVQSNSVWQSLFQWTCILNVTLGFYWTSLGWICYCYDQREQIISPGTKTPKILCRWKGVNSTWSN